MPQRVGSRVRHIQVRYSQVRHSQVRYSQARHSPAYQHAGDEVHLRSLALQHLRGQLHVPEDAVVDEGAHAPACVGVGAGAGEAGRHVKRSVQKLLESGEDGWDGGVRKSEGVVRQSER